MRSKICHISVSQQAIAHGPQDLMFRDEAGHGGHQNLSHQGSA